MQLRERCVRILLCVTLCTLAQTPILIPEAQLRAQDAPNPMLALWRVVRAGLTKDDGEQFFEDRVKDALLPGGTWGVEELTGKVVAVHRGKKVELVVAIDDRRGDATLQLDGRLEHEIEVDTQIGFEGVAKAFNKDPFMLTLEVDPRKIVRRQ